MTRWPENISSIPGHVGGGHEGVGAHRTLCRVVELWSFLPQSWHLQHKCEGRRIIKRLWNRNLVNQLVKSRTKRWVYRVNSCRNLERKRYKVSQGKPEVYQGKQQSTRENSKPSKPKSTKANEVNQSNQSLSKTNLPFSASHFSRYNIRHLG